MHGIVSILDAPNFTRVESVWRNLETVCGLKGVYITPVPHFSWQIAENYDLQRLETIIGEIASSNAPFPARASGLALFTGEKPVAYLPIVRDARLSELHAQIWQGSENIGDNLSPYYAPQAWMPHITIAYGDVNHQSMPCLMEHLAFQELNFEFQVDNLTFVFQPAEQVGLVIKKFTLGGR